MQELLNAITEALQKMEKYPNDNVQDIWNESLKSWETGLKMDHNFIIEPQIKYLK
jgi:hypothetical protein